MKPRKRPRKKRTEGRRQLRPFWPERVAAVDPDEFVFVLKLARDTYANSFVLDIPGAPAAKAEEPFRRMYSAIRDHCGDDKQKFVAMTARRFALGPIFEFKAIQTWTFEPSKIIHAAIFDAAAEMPVNAYGNFVEAELFARASEISYSGRYEEFGPPNP